MEKRLFDRAGFIDRSGNECGKPLDRATAIIDGQACALIHGDCSEVGRIERKVGRFARQSKPLHEMEPSNRG
jgi:hypothetical protein